MLVGLPCWCLHAAGRLSSVPQQLQQLLQSMLEPAQQLLQLQHGQLFEQHAVAVRQTFFDALQAVMPAMEGLMASASQVHLALTDPAAQMVFLIV